MSSKTGFGVAPYNIIIHSTTNTTVLLFNTLMTKSLLVDLVISLEEVKGQQEASWHIQLKISSYEPQLKQKET